MKHRMIVRLTTLFLVILGSLSAQAAGIDGAWQGELQAGGQVLRLVVNVASSDGALKITLDSPDQGAYGIATDDATFADNVLRFEIKRIGAVYEGKLTAEGTLSGSWSQYGVPAPLSLKPKAPVVRNRPQEPKPPFPYVAEEVSFENSKDDVKLAGTLTLPKSGKKFPAVLLMSGSGPQNRDGEIMGHKPFLVLADYLTRRGIAVLRVDDRGVGGTSKGSDSAASESYAQDTLAAVGFLKSRKDIDGKHIGLIGHSEGGLIASMAATQSNDVAFVVLLAGTGVPGRDVVVKQSELVMEAQKTPPFMRTSQLELQRSLLDIGMQSTDEVEAMAAFDSWWQVRSKELFGPFAASGAQADIAKNMGDVLRAQLKNVVSPWMRFFLAYDPAPTLSKVRVPVLAINGTLDLQVQASQNLPAVEAALKKGGNKDYTVQELPGLNHLFQAAKTGAPNEYIEIEETMNPKALEVIGNWVHRHVR